MERGKVEKLRQKIIGDAEAEARRIVQEGEAEAQGILADGAREADLIETAARARAEADGKEYVRRQVSLRELEARKGMLAEKGALMERAFADALSELGRMDREGGYEITRALLLKAIVSGDEEIVMSADDRGHLAPGFLDGINATLRARGKKGEVGFSEEVRRVGGGFILKRGRAEVNCSFGTLLAMLRDDIETEVAGILFGEV